VSYIICRFCRVRHLTMFSTSWKIGGCYICRDKLIPIYIPTEQHKQFLDKLHRKNYERSI
jgi:hypothetical protein